MRNKSVRKGRDPLPQHFDTLEEVAEFWGNHDSGDYEEYFRDVECKFDIKKKSHLISMDDALYKEVRAVARKKRVPAEKLVTRWIKEKLRSAA